MGDGTVRFFTEYQYKTRYGILGRLINLVFEPLMGWATAWSFDRLRLWIERGLDPALTLRLALIHGAARGILAFIFVYHGLVPKLLLHHPDELDMIARGGVPPALVLPVLYAVGVGEVVFGLWFLFSCSLVPFYIAAIGMVAALVGVAITAPDYLGAAFNPFTLNLAIIALSLMGILSAKDIPSAANCLRHRPKKDI